MKTVYTLQFYNDGGEWDDYGVYASRELAEQVIADTQAEFGDDVFPSENFEINEQVVRA